MRTAFAATVTWLVLATSAAAQGPPMPAAPGAQGANAVQLPPGTSTMRGRIFGADTGQPLRKAQVRVLQVDAPSVPGAGRENRMVTTDADGKYEFKELRAGRYTISASKGSYVTLQYGQTRPLEGGKPLEIIDNQIVERVDLTLPRGGIITGRILDEYGEPLSDIQIGAMRYQFIQGRRQLVPTGGMVTTNDLGEFRMFGISPGEYYVQATWRSQNPMAATAESTGYPPTFFPGTPNAAEAQRVTIGIGQQMDGVQMALRPSKSVRVKGTVTDSQGRPMRGMLMVGQSSGFGFTNMAAIIQPDGTFTLNGVSAGDYTLRAQQQGRPTPDSEIATTKLVVGSEDILDVQLVGAPPSTVKGRLIVDPAAVASLPARLTVAAVATEPMMMMGAMPSVVQDDLTFELRSPPGTFRLALVPGGMGFAVRSLRVNGADVTDSGFDVKPNAEVSGVELEVTNKLTTISGLVTNARGEAVKDYSAIAFAQDDKKWTLVNNRYQSQGRPDQDGRFKISGLPPGEYYVIAIDHLEQGQTGDPEFLERIRTNATSLSINEGETKTVDLKLQTAS
jgi:protocatechuate 3,4-dioxygenase beta subunit